MSDRSPEVGPRPGRLPPYAIQAFMGAARQREAEGHEMIHMEVGQMPENTPGHIIEAALSGMQDGHTKYTSSFGILDLREAISEDWAGRYGLRYDPGTEIICTPGGKHAIYLAMHALLDRGDEVLLPDPGYPPSEMAAIAAGATVSSYPLRPENNFDIDVADVAAAITDRTRAILINTPHNPTGRMVPKATLEALGDLAARHNLWIISDEVYDSLVFDGQAHHSLATMGHRDRTLVVQSFSKSFLMTGWRLGWAMGPNKLIAAMRALQDASTTCPTAFVQKAGAAALRHSWRLDQKAIEAKRDVLVAALQAAPGVEFIPPQGAMFCMVRLPGVSDCLDAAHRLLREQNVVVTPGGSFGKGAKGLVRMSFVGAEADLREAVRRCAACFPG